MKYNLNKVNKQRTGLVWLLVIVLGILVIFLLNVAYSCSTVARERKYTECDEVIEYPDGSKVCEIFLRPSVNAIKVQEQGATQEDRL